MLAGMWEWNAVRQQQVIASSVWYYPCYAEHVTGFLNCLHSFFISNQLLHNLNSFFFFNIEQWSAKINVSNRFSLSVHYRHQSLQSSRVDQTRQIQRPISHCVVARNPPLRHGLRRHTLRTRRPNPQGRPTFQNAHLGRMPGSHQKVPGHTGRRQTDIGGNMFTHVDDGRRGRFKCFHTTQLCWTEVPRPGDDK